jgi:hypothetical protein
VTFPRLLGCAVVVLCALPRVSSASGHGPVFGAATPTLGRGGWQLDQAWLVRTGDQDGTEEQTLRTMISFGITEDLQISASLPVNLVTPVYMPRGRLTATMSSMQELETSAAWRFHRKTMGSSRFESTLTGGVALPLESVRSDGMRATASMNVSAATGYASRAHYFWAGAGYVRQDERRGDKPGDVTFYSLVYGYRPPALRLEYPKPDLRFFVEAIGEHTGVARHHGFEMLWSGGTAVFAGPSTLLLYKAYGISGGVLFPVYQRTNGDPHERFRANINFTYFFWLD